MTTIFRLPCLTTNPRAPGAFGPCSTVKDVTDMDRGVRQRCWRLSIEHGPLPGLIQHLYNTAMRLISLQSGSNGNDDDSQTAHARRAPRPARRQHPWVPRLDLWYRANRRAGTLPRRYAGASLVEMLDDLGFACHAVIPDFKDLRTADDEVHRALGIYNLACMPVRTVFDGIEYCITQDGDQQIVEYNTPAGPLTTATVTTSRCVPRASQSPT